MSLLAPELQHLMLQWCKTKPRPRAFPCVSRGEGGCWSTVPGNALPAWHICFGSSPGWDKEDPARENAGSGRISAWHGHLALHPTVTRWGHTVGAIPMPRPHTSPGSQGGAGMRVLWIDQLFLGLAGRIILINTPIIAAAPQERDGMPALKREVLLNQ